ncbi:MAG: class I SAM-dependent methyltransferase [Comamonadaceae bacterium]|jgi:SAM-dependent methyltransferase|nr:class I SAM-dependent methyltransferase [Comamonadaceae bacterium]
MDREIIGLAQWFATDPGRYLLRWEQEQFDEALADVFGYHALQLGMPQLQAFRCNRMQHQWLATGGDLAGGEPTHQTIDPANGVVPHASVMLHSACLPFSANSLDLVVLPHTLELSDDPHLALREVERVLVPEGRVVISGLNPASLWGLRQRRSRWLPGMGRGQRFLPGQGQAIGHWRLRDWLRLLGFEVESARFGGYRPALTTDRWLQRFAWMDRLGARWWPIFGAVYFVVAVKRVRGMRLIEPGWRTSARRSAAPATAAQQKGGVGRESALSSERHRP